MTYGTRGTLRPTKPAEDYEIDQIEQMLIVVRNTAIAAIVVLMLLGATGWLYLA